MFFLSVVYYRCMKHYYKYLLTFNVAIKLVTYKHSIKGALLDSGSKLKIFLMIQSVFCRLLETLKFVTKRIYSI